MVQSDIIFDENNKDRLKNELFEKGQTVYIHPELRCTDKGLCVIPEMVEFKGLKTCITEKYFSYYSLEIDHGRWHWNDYMLLSENEYDEFIAPAVKKRELLGLLV